MDQIVLVDARCDSITISWMKAEEAVCYILEYRTVNPLEPDWQLLAEDIQGTSSRKRNLMPESQYFFRVSPVYEDDTVGPWLTHNDVFETISQEQDEDYAMAAPIVTIPVEPNALIITWEEVDEDVHGFEMQMRKVATSGVVRLFNTVQEFHKNGDIEIGSKLTKVPIKQRGKRMAEASREKFQQIWEDQGQPKGKRRKAKGSAGAAPLIGGLPRRQGPRPELGAH